MTVEPKNDSEKYWEIDDEWWQQCKWKVTYLLVSSFLSNFKLMDVGAVGCKLSS